MIQIDDIWTDYSYFCFILGSWLHSVFIGSGEESWLWRNSATHRVLGLGIGWQGHRITHSPWHTHSYTPPPKHTQIPTHTQPHTHTHTHPHPKITDTYTPTHTHPQHRQTDTGARGSVNRPGVRSHRRDKHSKQAFNPCSLQTHTRTLRIYQSRDPILSRGLGLHGWTEFWAQPFSIIQQLCWIATWLDFRKVKSPTKDWIYLSSGWCSFVDCGSGDSHEDLTICPSGTFSVWDCVRWVFCLFSSLLCGIFYYCAVLCFWDWFCVWVFYNEMLITPLLWMFWCNDVSNCFSWWP